MNLFYICLSQAQVLVKEFDDDTGPLKISISGTDTRAKRSALVSPEISFTDKNPKKVASISFAWNEPVGMAAFYREKFFWVVFDQRQTVNIKELTKITEPLALDFVQIPHSKGTLLRFTPRKDVKISVRKEGLLWIVDLFTTNEPVIVKEMQIITQTNSINEPYLFIPTTTSGNIISFIDPEVGDNIITAPNNDVDVGIDKSYKYPDLEFLKAIQGVAIVPNANDLILTRGNTGLNIQALNRGLYISPNLETLKMKEMLAQTTDEISSLTREIPQDLLSKKYNQVIRSLNDAVLSAPDDKKTQAELILARYYVGKGMGTEALTILNKIEADKKNEAFLDERFHGISGVANFLAGRYDEAIRHFSYGKLTTVNEGLFWFTLANAAKEFNKENNVIINSFVGIMRNYPERIKEKVAVIGAFNALEAYDDISTQNFIDILKSLSNADKNKGLIDYLNAEKYGIQGYPRNALKEYVTAAQSPDKKYSSIARFKAALLEHSLGIRNTDKTIAELEKLKYAWGERAFKLEILENLAGLYIKKQDYYNALTTLKAALEISSPEKKLHITSQMVTIFEDIFFFNQASEIPALKSLSLYDEFDWLAPKSEHYIEITQNIADRLVAVDLLGRASGILSKQLKMPSLTPIEKAKAGARLALINLMEGNNNQAINILDETDGLNLPETIIAQRKIIRAKALSGKGEQEEALALLDGDYSKNAILIKTDIFWNAGMWGDAADSIRYLIEAPTEDYELTKEQASLILDWILALKKSGKETVIIRIRNSFAPYFENTAYYSTFNVLTNTLDKDTVDMYSIDKAITDIKSFSNFSKIYDNSLKAETLK